MEPKSLRERVDTRVAVQLDERLVARLVESGGQLRRPARVATFVLATVVHAVALAFVVLGATLLLAGDNWVQRVLGAVALLPTVMLLRPVRDDDALERIELERAPHVGALVRAVADALGTPPPTVVALSPDINAYAVRLGLRERRLVIGAPLWAALGPQARIALLGHELAHFSHRDVVHGRYVWWAERTLDLWIDLVTPDGLVSTDGRTPLLASFATAPLRLPLVGLAHLILRTGAVASRHDELRADTVAAQVAGTAGAVETLEAVLLADVIDVAANRAAVDPKRPDLAAEIAARVAGVSAAARRALPAEEAEHRVDRTHPRTVDRLRLQESLPPASPRIVLDEARRAAVDEELRPAMTAALKRLADAYRHVW